MTKEKDDVTPKNIDEKNEPDKAEFELWKRNKEKSRQEQMDTSLSKIKELEMILQEKVNTNGKKTPETKKTEKEEPNIYASWLE